MAKLVLNPITTFTNDASAASLVNANSTAIEAALENTLSRDGTLPNQMGADIDLNSNDLLNVGSLDTATLTVAGEDIHDIVGLPGPTGPIGPTGPAGPTGQGVPIGGTINQVLAKNSSTNYDTKWVDQTGGGGSGTVTSFSVVALNGFNGSVSNATTTPALTITTSVTGILKGSSGALVSAAAGTDYQVPISLTTIGTSGAATFTGGVLNIPQYTSGGGGSGNVSGPGVSVVDHIATWNATDGTLLKDSGKILPTGTVVGTTDTQTLTNKNLTGAGNTFPTFNQNTTGNAATVTTNANLTGPVTSVGNATAFAPATLGYSLTGNGAGAPTYQGFTQTGTGAVTRTWQAKAAETASVADFGAIGNAISVTITASITSGSGALTATGASFTSADVGKSIIIPGAGAAGVALSTTISTFTDATHIGLTANAATTLSSVTNVHIAYGTDDTVAIQAAINSGATAVYIPSKTYFCGNLLLPNTVQGFVLYGDGPSSVLLQNTNTAPLIHWTSTSMVFNNIQYVRDLCFIGTNGASNTIDTSGQADTTLLNLYFIDIPVGFSSIYVNGAASTYTHDIRVINCQSYSLTAGNSVVRFGPLAADCSISNLIANGNLVVINSIVLDSGSGAIKISDSHVFNNVTNVIKLSGSNTECQFIGVSFDRSDGGDLVSISSANDCTFTNCLFQSISPGHSGVSLANSFNMSFVNCTWLAGSGAVSAAVETGTSNNNTFIGGSINTIANYSSVFNLIGNRSYARSIPDVNPLGLSYSFSGATSTPQTQATTQFLGVNAGQATEINTSYSVPYPGVLVSMRIVFDTTPASGQTFTLTARKNGTNIGTPMVVNNGSFGGNITLNVAVATNDFIDVQSTFSATSGSSTIKYMFYFTG